MSRSLQDQFIDDDDEEEVCPLCVEELDYTDKNFKPCPCGYQICQFCFKNIRDTMNGLCPACRRPYGPDTIEYKQISPEEIAQHKHQAAQQAKKKLAARQKEAQKKEADHLSRKHLAGLRVRQKNLVYVTGLKPTVSGEKLVQGLRDKDYFGQYGEILKIVVSKTKDAHHHQNQPVGVYVTFVNKDDAALCIATIDGSKQPDGSKLRAQYGTTKYCSAYLRGDTCTNKNCMFLHEPGEDSESFTRQDLSNLNAISTQQPAAVPLSHSPQPQAPIQYAHPVAAASLANEHAIQSPVDSPRDGPALPATASWADSARRQSRTTNTSTNSPLVVSSVPAVPEVQESKPAPQAPEPSLQRSAVAPKKHRKPKFPYFEDLPRLAFATIHDSAFFFPETFSEKDRWIVENTPPLFDPNEGTRRRLIKERQTQELEREAEAEAARLEAQAEANKAAQAESDEAADQAPGGSSQLGGEPEERPERNFGGQSLLPQHVIGSSQLGLGQGFGLADDINSLTGRTIGQQSTQMQQQQLLLQQLKLGGQGGNHNANHGRQPSRFFLNEAMGTASKNFAKQANANHFGNSVGQNQSVGNQFAFTSVQGPPPGLKTTGTPPVTGGGMFAQGHGFTPGAYGRENDKLWDTHQRRGNSGALDAGKLPDLGQSVPDQKAALKDSDFPALPKPVSKPESRSGTPVVPPGFTVPPAVQQFNKNKSATPVLRPATPIKPVIPKSSPNEAAKLLKPKSQAEQDGVQMVTKDEASVKGDKTVDESLQTKPGKPIARKENEVPGKGTAKASKASAKERTTKKGRSRSSTLAESSESATVPLPFPTDAKGKNKATEPQPAKTEAPSKPPPGSLRITTTTLEKSLSSDVRSRPQSTAASAANSRPGTPGAETIATPIKRPPRTIRITDTPRTETPSLPSASATPAPWANVSKVVSRRTSMASLNPPGTPLSENVDTNSIRSASVAASRANSPPPLMGKKRAEKKEKKPRKSKKKEVEEVEAPPSEPVEEHSPVLGRKKKTKKPGTTVVPPKKPVQPTPQPVSNTPVQIEEPKQPEPVKEEPELEKIAQPIESVVPEAAPAVEIDEPDSTLSSDPEPYAGLPPSLASLVPEFERLFSSALTKTLSPNSHLRGLSPADVNAFTQPSAAPPPHSFVFVPSPSDQAARAAHTPIRRSDPDGSLASRFLETVKGTKLRALTEEEENALIELENRASQVPAPAFWGGGKPEYLLPGMPGHEAYTRRRMKDAIAHLPPPHTVSDRQLSGEAPGESRAMVNRFVFPVGETDGMGRGRMGLGEKAPSYAEDGIRVHTGDVLEGRGAELRVEVLKLKLEEQREEQKRLEESLNEIIRSNRKLLGALRKKE